MIRKLISEPLVHFAVAGLAIFGLFSLTNDAPTVTDADEIVVSVEDARWLAEQFETTWRRPPQPRELNGLIDDFITEEILVREALALGLDQNDTIVRRRLRQKMEFLSEAPAAAATPDDAALIAFLNENAGKFARPPRIAFEQVLLADDGKNADEIFAALTAGGDPRALSAQTLLPYSLPESTSAAIDGTFGSGFFEQLATLSVGVWQGPVKSGFGAHLVRLNSLTPIELPDFESVRDRVELEWRASEAAKQRVRFVELLADDYQISRPDAAEVLE